MLGLGLNVRARKLLHRLRRWRQQRARTHLVRRKAERLHIGCGPEIFPGWVNIDLEPYPGVDVVHDVTEGLPFEDVRYIYAEHFVEHLTYDDGLRFFRECRAALREDGVLRISTPNLDWVQKTQYAAADPIVNCFAMNKAFRGWGHQFLYNPQTLEATLHAAGFDRIDWKRYGHSDDPVLTGLERHEQSPDFPGAPHVIVVEASGVRRGSAAGLEQVIEDYDRALRS